ncbi:MAG: hypothetical protein AB1Z98_33395 [Nannocystaceae bacterium]
MIARALLPMLGALAMLSTACGDKGKDEGNKDDTKLDTKVDAKDGEADEGEAPLAVASGDDAVDGPVPPETSMVFFQVEGALIPLACFDKAKGKMMAGTGCLDLVPADAEVRVSSGDQAFNKKVGERAEPSCMAGSDKKIALSAQDLTGGAEFSYGAWPPSALKTMKKVSDDSTSPMATQLDDDARAKLTAKVGKGEITAHQVAEVDVDGNDDKDGIYSVFVPHPKMAEQYTWSGVFLARDGNLDDLVLIDKSESRKDVFEVLGVLDVDGTGTKELWVRMIYEDGAGDAVFELEGDSGKALGKWSCGA